MRIGIGVGLGIEKTSIEEVENEEQFFAPEFTLAPVASGTTNIGDTLNVTNGSTTGTLPINYTYQWYRSGFGAIPGATSNTYLITASDAGNSVFCDVTATNTYGETSQVSNSLSIPALFTFSNLENNMLHVNPNDTGSITQTSGEVSQINDLSGNSRNLTQSNASFRPSIGGSVGTSAALVYANKFLRRDTTVISQNMNRLYFAAVVKANSAASIRTIAHISQFSNTGASRLICRLSAAGLLEIGGRRLDANTLSVRSGAVNRNGTTFIVVMGLEYLSANSFARVNGVITIADGAFQTSGSSENSTAATLNIGARLTNDYWATDIGECLFFTASSDLPDSILEKVEGLLAHNAGLTSELSVSHPYKIYPPQV